MIASVGERTPVFHLFTIISFSFNGRGVYLNNCCAIDLAVAVDYFQLGLPFSGASGTEASGAAAV